MTGAVELVGAALLACDDPEKGADALARALEQGAERVADSTISLRLEPALVRLLHRELRNGGESAASLARLGLAWANGYRASGDKAPWELVVSMPQAFGLPPGISRTTGETLIYLVTEATHSLTLAAPFIDETGIGFLKEAIAAATRRGVQVRIVSDTRRTQTEASLESLTEYVSSEGKADGLAIAGLSRNAPWPHLKVLVADSQVAYVGSANLTLAGLGGGNVELGVLLRGRQASYIEALVDRIQDA